MIDKTLVDEWLLTISDEEDYWDGTHCSPRAMAKKYLTEFLGWLQKRELELRDIGRQLDKG